MRFEALTSKTNGATGLLAAHMVKDGNLNPQCTDSETQSDKFSGNRSCIYRKLSSSHRCDTQSRSCESLSCIQPFNAYF